jgi:hypothetical protein
MTSRPTPVFVLGLPRSGTTWLANIIAQHSRATAVQSQDHFGILESMFFSHFAPAYGGLDNESNFRRFVTDFASSDYYLVSGLDANWLTGVQSRSYPEIFRTMMEEVARRHGAEFWVEKSPAHTYLADELATVFPDARFICVVRRPQDAIASMFWLHEPPNSQLARVRTLLSLSLSRAQQCLLMQFCRRHKDRCLLTQYEVFVGDTEAETRRTCEFLGVDYEPAMLDLRWRRNTSFHSVDRRRAFGPGDRVILEVTRAMLSLAPLPVLRSLLARRRTRKRTREGGIVFPDSVWRRRDSGPTPPFHDREYPVDTGSGDGTDA